MANNKYKFKKNDRVENLQDGHTGVVIKRTTAYDHKGGAICAVYYVRWEYEVKTWVSSHYEHQLVASTSTPPDRIKIVMEKFDSWERSDLADFLDDLVIAHPELIDLPEFQIQFV